MERKPLDLAAYSLMVLLTALWGFQQVTIKVIAGDVSLIAQAAIERLGGTVALSERRSGGTCVRIELPGFRLSSETRRAVMR